MDPQGEDFELHDVPITVSRSYEHKSKNHPTKKRGSKKQKLLCHNCKTSLDNNKNKGSLSILDLPTLVMVNILTRLPVYSIFRCKSVCKALYEIISDPYFADSYVASPPFVSILVSCDDVLSYWLELKAGNSNYYLVSPNKPVSLGNIFNFLKCEEKNDLVTVGCSNGLVCVLHRTYSPNEADLYVSNPILRECVKILRPSEKRVRESAYGFGYSSTTGRFKILRIAKKKYYRKPIKSEAEIYTLGVDKSWRSLGEAPFPNHRTICGITLHDSLHWIEEADNEADVRLLTFSMVDERVRQLPLPPDIRGVFNLVLGAMGNGLCIFDYNVDHELGIWWMTKYGVGESWRRIRILESCVSPDFRSQLLLPITIWRGGEILMLSRFGVLYSFNPGASEEELSTQIKVSSMGDDFCEAILYVPSFFSLKTVMGDDVQMINVT